MTCWLIKEPWETVLGIASKVGIVVSDCILISVLSVSLEPLEMSCVEAVDAQLLVLGT